MVLFIIEKNGERIAKLQILELDCGITLYAIKRKDKYEVIDGQQFVGILEVAQKHGYDISFYVVHENCQRN